MPSFRNVVAFVAAALVASVQADYYINPDSVSLTDRKFWCQSELTTCPIICAQNTDGKPLTNTCDPATLTYGCVCSNGLQPNVSEYSLTLPYYVCQEWGNQCVKGCGQGNNGCADACRSDHPCGAQNPSRVTSTSSSSTPTSTGAAQTNQVYSGFGGSDSSSGSGSGSGSKTDKSAAPALGAERVGFVVVFGSIVAGMAMLL